MTSIVLLKGALVLNMVNGISVKGEHEDRVIVESNNLSDTEQDIALGAA